MRVLITGASSGIGEAFAKEFAKMGCSLVLTARRTDRLMKLKTELNTEVDIITADLSNPADAMRVFSTAKNVDILINNAGFGVFGEFLQTPLDKELSMIDVNIRAVHMLMKLYLSEFEKRGSGKILNVASSAAFCPGPMFSSYYASKAYVYRLTLAVDRELKIAKSGVRVSVLCPGPVTTEFDKVANVSFTVGSLTPEYVAKYAVKKLLKGKTVIVPGFMMKCIRFFSALAPEQFTARVTYKIQKSKDVLK